MGLNLVLLLLCQLIFASHFLTFAAAIFDIARESSKCDKSKRENENSIICFENRRSSSKHRCYAT